MTHTAHSIAELLEEAGDTLRRLHFNTPKDGPGQYKSCMPATVREYWAAYGAQQVSVKPGPPTAAAIDRLDMVLALVVETLDEDDRALIWARCIYPRVRWKKIAKRLCCSRMTAWRRWMDALMRLAEKANGKRAAA